jgi:oligoendopeptidase F
VVALDKYTMPMSDKNITENTAENSTNIPSWDLTAYYNSFNDAQIELDLKVGREKSEEFATNFRTKVSNLSANELLKAIKTDEELTLLLNKPAQYLHLLYEAGGSEIELIQQKMISVNEVTTHIANLTTFFGVELSKRPDLVELSSYPALS